MNSLITSLDGESIVPADIRILNREQERTVLQIIIYEGKNRQIRRMCEAVGLTVIRLKRTFIGKIKLGMLKTGDWRPLTEKEVRYLSGKGSSNDLI